jgi:hypothetical protein
MGPVVRQNLAREPGPRSSRSPRPDRHTCGAVGGRPNAGEWSAIPRVGQLSALATGRRPSFCDVTPEVVRRRGARTDGAGRQPRVTRPLYRRWVRNGARCGRIFPEGQMGPRAVVVDEVRCQDSVQMALAQDDHMVETFSAHRLDQALDVGILPRGARGTHDLLDAHAPEAAAEGRAVDAIAIAYQVFRGAVLGGTPRRSAGRSRQRWDARSR